MHINNSFQNIRRGFEIFAACLLISTVMSCAVAPELVGIDNTEKPAKSVVEASKQKIFIMTTRQATEATGAFYSGQRAPELGLASVVVSIPPNHVSGNLERAKRLPPDPETEFAVIDPAIYQTDNGFVRSVNTELAKLPSSDRDILLFVHGYNNTISDSILRLAQFVEDTNFQGVPVLFSWASAAQPIKYVYDMNSALAARPQLEEGARILTKTKAKGANVFAHSMGAMLTMEVIVAAELQGGFNKTGRVKNVMLAAPDIDIDVFRSQMSRIKKQKQNLFVLVSKDDSALSFSRRISGGVNRVGSADAEELAEFGVTVIDLSEIDDSASGSHNKFAGSPDVVKLIGQGLNDANRFGPRSQNQLQDLILGLPIQVVVN
jgi:esterase/lipase superfamily enzyme